MKIKIFVSDLLSFESKESSQKRLETGQMFYMSEFHFADEERELILNFPTRNGLLFFEYMKFKFQEKANAGNTEICAAHDIAPAFLKIFGIQKGFTEEKIFKTAQKAFEKNYKQILTKK